MTPRVEHGDCRDVLTTLAADSLDACVTDPPYHLTSGVLGFDNASLGPHPNARPRAGKPRPTGFMGQTWDGGDIAFDPDTWRAVLRVLKPGAHLLAFGGTRTAHRMTCAIEDAGFEIRDSLCWLYGSGFPKSLDVSKAIDRAAGAEREVVGTRRADDIRGGNLNHRACNGDRATHTIDITAPATPEAVAWAGWGTALKPAYEPIILARKPLSERTVAANVLRHGTGAINVDATRIQVAGQRPYDIKGAWEPGQHLCASCAEPAEQSARREAPASKASTATRHAAPTMSARGVSTSEATSKTDTGCCDGTLAGDMLGSSSIGASGKTPTGQSQTDLSSTTSTTTSSTIGLKTCVACGASITRRNTPRTEHGQNGSPPTRQGQGSIAPQGRWPSNVLLDGSPEVMAAFPQTTSGKMMPTHTEADRSVFGQNAAGGYTTMETYGDTGSAARFFYSSKATALDRADSRHPTVKPVDLMRWLVRLITPPGGTVLDCFAGSGTTAEAAMLEGFNALLIEQDAQHATDIRHRVARWSGLDTPLFAEPEP